MSDYTFLLSSLPEQVFGQPQREPRVSTRELFLRCMEEMDPRDFHQVRVLHLFNDIKNAVFFAFYAKSRQEDFKSPSYYEESTFMAFRSDPLEFLPFLQVFHELKARKSRALPDLPETDELTWHFYTHLDDLLEPCFLKDYLVFLCNLRNCASAVAFRKSGMPISQKLIPWGEAWTRIRANEQAADFGLGQEFPFIGTLQRASDEGRLVFEQAIDRVLWDWLDDNLAGGAFSVEAVLAYFVRLASTERWESLRDEAGSAVVEGILNTVRRSVRFSVEFNKTGDR